MDAPAAPPPPMTVSVRALCDFVARRGDLDVRFTPAPTALEGIEGHAAVAARRGAGYQAEVPLEAAHAGLRVRGRADGWDPARGRLEEIKTRRGRLDRLPAHHRALHQAQLDTYGWMLCARDGRASVELALVYFDIGTRQETVLAETVDAATLRARFEAACEAYLAWAAQEAAHRAVRDRALAALPFPHADFRAGQRPLAEAVFRATRAGRCLLAQAPTGIGKTVGTLFPALRAMPGQGLDRLFFLTAKTPGRALALGAVQALRQGHPALPLRTLELVARDKACEHPDRACHGASCPLAEGFHDRLPGARAEAVTQPLWDREAVRAIALAHRICPYYLAQELAHWADVVVGDYNHFLDLSAMLHALTVLHGWRVALLLDEAHNLIDRARGMHSAELDQVRLRGLRRDAPKALRRPLDRLHRVWKALNAEHGLDAWKELPGGLPEDWTGALQQCATAILDHAAEHPEEVGPDLQRFMFDALHLGRLAELHGPHSLADLTPSPDRRSTTIGLRNLVPAPFLRARWAAAHAATLFSATLQPPAHPRALLGLPDDCAWIEVDSPFDASRLAVHVARDISTRWQHREASIAPIVARIAAQHDARPGLYLVFASSFDYLDRLADAFAAARPDVPAWRQSRQMREDERGAFLARFEPGGRGIGFAVLGGAFGEGIDLPGDRLIGAFIATLGLPQVNPINERMRQRLDAMTDGRGFEHAYLYPGIQKVVQAAGRVIRTPEDHGVVHLMDARFGRADVRGLLPRAWFDRPAQG